MAQKNGFMPIKSLQKQPKRSLRRSKTPPRFFYDVPRRPKTPPRRSQERPRGLQDPSKTPPRRLQEAPKTPLRSSQEPVKKRPMGYPCFGRQEPMGYPIFGRFLIDVWSMFDWFLVDCCSIFIDVSFHFKVQKTSVSTSKNKKSNTIWQYKANSCIPTSIWQMCAPILLHIFDGY